MRGALTWSARVPRADFGVLAEDRSQRSPLPGYPTLPQRTSRDGSPRGRGQQHARRVRSRKSGVAKLWLRFGTECCALRTEHLNGMRTRASALRWDLMRTGASALRWDLMRTGASALRWDLMRTGASALRWDLMRTGASALRWDLMRTGASALRWDLMRTGASALRLKSDADGGGRAPL
ncbi:hypothetical protein EI77_04243 [Prosthecobacter fusiformis]|uniref:Uncharacterized protein n=1 Tax=Prosthecobacter fusiformis TaxID=48464 RepID=A0A4R7RJ82_9BACT|nr:hypothetical protein EI77_04243 [Prosthecobacter fusiformis]